MLTDEHEVPNENADEMATDETEMYSGNQDKIETDEYQMPNENGEENQELQELLNEELPEVGRCKPFPTWLLKNTEEEVVQRLPGNIDGFKKYKVETTKETWTNDTGD